MSHAKLLKGLRECCHCSCEMPRLRAEGHAKAMWLSEAPPLALAEGRQTERMRSPLHALACDETWYIGSHPSHPPFAKVAKGAQMWRELCE